MLARLGGIAAGYSPTPAGEPIVVLLSKRRVCPGRVCGWCVNPAGGIATGYPPTLAGKPIAVLLSKRRVLEESGVPHPGRVMPLLTAPYPGRGANRGVVEQAQGLPRPGVRLVCLPGWVVSLLAIPPPRPGRQSLCR